MISIIDIPTEQTTAFTDLILGLVVVGVFISIFRLPGNTSGTKTRIWLSMFAFLGVASFVGTFAHGFAMSHQLNFYLWQPINLTLGLVIAMFVAATIFDIWGPAAYRKTQLVLIGVAIIFYGTTLLIPGTFLTFIVYEAGAMLFALAGYFYLAVKNKMAGAWWFVAGILITIIAAVIQAVGKNGVVIFLGLDHNGVFHLIQLFGVLALLNGFKRSIAKDAMVIHADRIRA